MTEPFIDGDGGYMRTGMTTLAKRPHRPDSSDVAASVEEQVDRHPMLLEVAKYGWLAKGILYSLLAVLVLRVGHAGAFGLYESGEASPTGALEEVASRPFGRALLAVLATGLVLYSLWRLLTVLLPGEHGVEPLLKRGGYLFSALTYAFLAYVAAGMAWRGEREAGDESGLLRSLMSEPWGRWLVAGIGVIALGSAAYFVYKGIGRRFAEQVDFTGMARWHRATVDALGVAGWVGRSVVMFLVGWFLIYAAVTYDVDAAGGLDAMLRNTADTTTGSALVIAAGAGLGLYALFCLATWRRRILRGA